jgi:hypothetical protein
MFEYTFRYPTFFYTVRPIIVSLKPFYFALSILSCFGLSSSAVRVEPFLLLLSNSAPLFLARLEYSKERVQAHPNNLTTLAKKG